MRIIFVKRNSICIGHGKTVFVIKPNEIIKLQTILKEASLEWGKKFSKKGEKDVGSDNPIIPV